MSRPAISNQAALGIALTIAGSVLIDRAYRGATRPTAVRALQLVGGLSDVLTGLARR